MARCAKAMGALTRAVGELHEQSSASASGNSRPDRSAIICLDLFERTPRRHTDGAERQCRGYSPLFRRLAQSRADCRRQRLRACAYPARFAERYLKHLDIGSMLDAPIIVDGNVRASSAWSSRRSTAMDGRSPNCWSSPSPTLRHWCMERVERNRMRRRVAHRQSRGRIGDAGQVRVPGQYEPRDPHAHERRVRHDGNSAAHRTRRASAAAGRNRPAIGQDTADDHQRHPRHLADRGGQARAGQRRIST